MCSVHHYYLRFTIFHYDDTCGPNVSFIVCLLLVAQVRIPRRAMNMQLCAKGGLPSSLGKFYISYSTRLSAMHKKLLHNKPTTQI